MQYFTFGVISYNQQDYILETLESIKYQIKNYGDNIQFKLIISDDCSKDNTLALIDKWLKKNKDYFTEVKIITSEKNLGTVRNRQRMLDAIDTKYYKSIAGDDLFSNCNLFSHLLLLREYDIVSYFPLLLSDDKLYYDENRLVRMYYNKNRQRSYYLKELKRGSLFHTPSTFYNEELYNSEVKTFVNKFRLFEDDPRWYMFLKLNRNINIKFIEEPLIIYRMHNLSICHGSSNPNSSIFASEVNELRKTYYKDEKSVLMKMYLLLQMISDKILIKYLKPINYIRKLDIYVKKILLYNNRNYDLTKEAVNNYLDNARNYYTEIRASIKEYY